MMRKRKADSKSQIDFYYRIHAKKNLSNIKIPACYGETVILAGEAKYPGIILDSKLNFKPYVIKVTNKATRALWVCKIMPGRNQGLRPEMMHQFYITVVVLILRYGYLIQWERTKLGDCHTRLEKLQRLACLGITANMTAYKLKINNSLGSRLNQAQPNKINEIEPKLMMRSDKMLPKVTFNKTYQITLSSKDNWRQVHNERTYLVY